MVNTNEFEFVILKMTYLPSLDPDSPKITLNRKKQKPSDLLENVACWLTRVLTIERAKLETTITCIRFTEWDIISGNAKLFQVNSSLFERIAVVMGVDTMYWLYYLNVPAGGRIEGFGPINVSFCPCCLQQQYLIILDSVRTYLMKQLSDSS